MKKHFFLLLFLFSLCHAAYLVPDELSQLVRSMECRSPIIFKIRDTAIPFGNSWMSRKAFTTNKHLTGEIPDQTPPTDLSFTVNDYSGNEISTGELKLRTDGYYELLPFWAENGYYEIVLPGFENQSIGILVIPQNKAATDEFFAMDACFTCFTDYYTAKRINSFATILDYCGIRKVRDRLKWRLIQPNSIHDYDLEMKDWDALTRRNMAKDHNLATLDVFHESPAWIRSATRTRGFPDDLLNVAKCWGKIGAGYAEVDDALEVWNEIDLGDADGLPADQYCAFLKAISNGFYRNSVDTSICACGYAALSEGHWQNKIPNVVDNGMLENSDVFSYHNYEDLESIETNTGYFRDYLEGNPRQGIPIYMTEVGQPWDGMDIDRPTLDDELHSATSITGKAIEGKAVGIARYYVFVLNSYDEINKNFGLFDRHDTPLRNFAAYATCCRLLSGLEYIGDISGLGRVLAEPNGDNAIVSIICEKDSPQKVIPDWLKTPDTKLIQADGKVLATGEELPKLGIKAGDTLYYLQVSRNTVMPHLNTDTKAMRLLQIARNYKPTPRLNLPGIIQYHIDDTSNRNWSLRGYYFYDLSRVEFDIVFNNLSDTEITFHPEVSLPQKSVLLQPMPAEITVAPNSRQSARIALDLRETFSCGLPYSTLKISDANGNADILSIRLNTKHWQNKAYAKQGIDNDIEAKLTNSFNEAKRNGFDVEHQFHPLFDGINFSGQENWEQEEGSATPDIEAQFMVNYDADTLQFIVQVRDDNAFLQRHPTNNMWQGDSVQICFQTGRNSNKNTELTISECNGAPMIYAHFTQYHVGDEFYHSQPIEPNEAKVLHLDAHNYVYIANIDLVKLEQDGLTPGADVSLALLVNSSDGQVRSGYLKWGDGIGRFKDNGYFNQLVLEK